MEDGKVTKPSENSLAAPLINVDDPKINQAFTANQRWVRMSMSLASIFCLAVLVLSCLEIPKHIAHRAQGNYRTYPDSIACAVIGVFASGAAVIAANCWPGPLGLNRREAIAAMQESHWSVKVPQDKGCGEDSVLKVFSVPTTENYVSALVIMGSIGANIAGSTVTVFGLPARSQGSPLDLEIHVLPFVECMIYWWLLVNLLVGFQSFEPIRIAMGFHQLKNFSMLACLGMCEGQFGFVKNHCCKRRGCARVCSALINLVGLVSCAIAGFMTLMTKVKALAFVADTIMMDFSLSQWLQVFMFANNIVNFKHANSLPALGLSDGLTAVDTWISTLNGKVIGDGKVIDQKYLGNFWKASFGVTMVKCHGRLKSLLFILTMSECDVSKLFNE